MITIRKYSLFKIFIYILVFELLGVLSGLIVGKPDMTVFEEINAFAPPSFVFGIVWTILYAALGFIGYLVYSRGPNNAKTAFTFHMLLNYSWTYVFFVLNSYEIAMFIILLMIGSLLYIRIWIKDVDKFANILCIVYFIWLVYALFLNFMVIIS